MSLEKGLKGDLKGNRLRIPKPSAQGGGILPHFCNSETHIPFTLTCLKSRHMPTSLVGLLFHLVSGYAHEI